MKFRVAVVHARIYPKNATKDTIAIIFFGTRDSYDSEALRAIHLDLWEIWDSFAAQTTNPGAILGRGIPWEPFGSAIFFVFDSWLRCCSPLASLGSALWCWLRRQQLER